MIEHDFNNYILKDVGLMLKETFKDIYTREEFLALVPTPTKYLLWECQGQQLWLWDWEGHSVAAEIIDL